MNSASVALRDYQREMQTRLFSAWRSHRSVLVQMPTGTGKTHVLASVIAAFLREKSLALSEAHGAVWIIAHRRELVSQIESTVARYGIGQETGTVRAMSIQWLSRHWEDVEGRPALIVIDEAHHALAATYMELWRRYPEALKLGLTATPCRLNGRGFTDLFEELLTSWSIGEFILKGHLSLFDYVTICSGSAEQRLIAGLEKRGADGDYQIKEMESALNHRPSIERLYESVACYASGRKGIVYAISRDHAHRIADCYNSHGLLAAGIDSGTPSGERQRLVEEFRNNRLQVLVNVDIFSEGFDCPDVEFVQLARPTLSLSKYLQQVGRGLRRSEGKGACMLIDNVGLYRVFGLPTTEWDWPAMFRGELRGKGVALLSSTQGGLRSCEVSAQASEGVGMEMVMSHERLREALREPTAPPEKAERPVTGLTPWQDPGSGLWGLQSGGKKMTEAIYIEAPLIYRNRAAVRSRDRRIALLDGGGKKVWEALHCRAVRFTRNDFLVTVAGNGKERYTDLHSLRSYETLPEVRHYGAVELLRVGRTYYSRTKRVYENAWNVSRHGVIRHRFYVTLYDPQAPAGSRPSVGNTLPARGGYACLLDGDGEDYYWFYSELRDGSIIVQDATGRYYHASEGEGKRLLGDKDTAADELELRAAITEVSARAKERAEAQQLAKEDRLRQLRASFSLALPFRVGAKWGLKSGDRIVVPPIYRNVRPPVGRYCAVEESYSRWGIVREDGAVVVEPLYPAVTISEDGTAVLTLVTGKSIEVRL